MTAKVILNDSKCGINGIILKIPPGLILHCLKVGHDYEWQPHQQ
jgi:hypothetical protein